MNEPDLGTPRVTDVLSFALFTSTTLSSPCDGVVDERGFNDLTEETTEEAKRNIVLRNKCLELFLSLLYLDHGQIHTTYCEDVVQVVGFDWILLFLQGRCHPTTVVLRSGH